MKRFIVELIGTFFLTLAIALTSNPLCFGIMFSAVIYLGAHVSGGYYNPAITLALFLRGKHKVDHLAHLILGQIVGACLALCLAYHSAGQAFTLSADPSNISMSCLTELLLAFLLCALVLSVSAQKLKEAGGLILGFTLMSLGYIGGVVNPAISFASQLLCMFHSGGGLDINSLLVFFVCPLIGGAVAAVGYKHYQD